MRLHYEMLQILNNTFKKTNNIKSYDPRTMARELEKLRYKRELSSVNGERFFYFLRNCWGILLAIALIVSIIFQFWLTYMIGMGDLNFKGYEIFLNIIAGENFIQVVGLCYIVVNFLFPKSNNNQNL